MNFEQIIRLPKQPKPFFEGTVEEFPGSKFIEANLTCKLCGTRIHLLLTDFDPLKMSPEYTRLTVLARAHKRHECPYCKKYNAEPANMRKHLPDVLRGIEIFSEVKDKITRGKLDPAVMPGFVQEEP